MKVKGHGSIVEGWNNHDKGSLYEQIVEQLPIDRDSLDTELEQQAAIHHRIGESLAEATAAQRAARDELDATSGRMIADLMATHSKMSKTAAESQIKMEEEYLEVRHGYTVACEQVDRWSSLQQAWIQRSYALANLAELYVNDYFTSDSARSKRGPHEAKSPRKQRTRIAE